MPTIPHRIPPPTPAVVAGGGSSLPGANEFSLYDVALNGHGFTYANTANNPLVRETVDYVKERIDQAATAGEQTLSNWWIESQDSFHGGAGQLHLKAREEDAVAHIRYDLSKNVDPFTPGYLTRLPDTKIASAANVTAVVGIAVSGADAVAVLLNTGAVNLITNLDNITPTVTAVTGVSSVLALATDGARIYCATSTVIKSVDPATPTLSTTICTYAAAATTGPVIGWAKSRLMLGVNGGVYQVDVSTTGVTLGASQLLLQHPSPGWTWRCFSDSPSAVLAAGDAGAFSEVEQFTINDVAGAPTLQPAGTVLTLPQAERVLSMCNVMGSFQAIGTTRGVRVAIADSLYGRLSLGPLMLSPVDPVIPGNAVITRDRFVYVAGKDYDEAGLLAVNLGVQVDNAGRFAWAPSLICPTTQTNLSATGAALLPVSARIVFVVPTVGLVLEGVGAGTVREAWVRSSRIRFGTTEPKLFKLGSVRADLTSADVQVVATTPSGTSPLTTLGFATELPDFRLPSDRTEWLQLQFNVSGAGAIFRSYSVKALPGTPRQVRIKLVLTIADSETTRSGQRIRDAMSARAQRETLEALASAGDEVLLQEFTPLGVVSTVVVIERVSFAQTGRPTQRSDVGGEATVICRTLES